jgi:chemotaxis protein MotB
MTDPSLGKQTPLVVVRKKRRKRAHRGGHAGAWKIAYADFVTAMMAFFLLMWLMMSTNHGTLEGIAEFFNRPLQSLFTQGPGVDQNLPQTNTQRDKEKDEAQQQADDRRKLQQLREKIAELVERNPKLQAFKNQIKLDITSEGLRIQIVDDKDRPMFAVGSAVLEDYTKAILDQIGKALNDVPNPISIAGHTDNLPYAGAAAGYSNWELSTERANAARRELIAGGMRQGKVLEIRGLADAIPLIKNDPANPQNRRISIVVMNKEAVERFKADGNTLDVGAAKPLEPSEVK